MSKKYIRLKKYLKLIFYINIKIIQFINIKIIQFIKLKKIQSILQASMHFWKRGSFRFALHDNNLKILRIPFKRSKLLNKLDLQRVARWKLRLTHVLN
jgi:hypothetical protein